MSRAFVKEDDASSEIVAPRHNRNHPYYTTEEGLSVLRERLARAQAAGNEREAEDVRNRLDEAILVDLAAQDPKRVQFGATVALKQPGGKKQRYRIVGEDEADPLNGTISWLSPLAQALLEHRAGDRVVWERPAGNMPVEIVSISYE